MSAILTSPPPHPLKNKTPIGYPYPHDDKHQTSQDRTTRWALPPHTPSRPPPTTPPHYTSQHHTTRTLPQLTLAERLTPARKTIAQRARTQHPYPYPIPNRYHQHFQHSFDPDGTTVPRTGTSIPSTHGTSHPANTPFARGLRKAQRFVRAGWLHDDPNACCVPLS
jgi:hypothetical protein